MKPAVAHRSFLAREHSFATYQILEPAHTLGIKDSASAEPRPARWKRCLDLTLLFLAFPGALLLMGFIAAIIAVLSPGPVLFKQERVGFRRRRFVCLKFRTMKVDADCTRHHQHLHDLLHSNKPMRKLDEAGDDRLIPFARILRASGLDELPQLINVLRGEMSLVGPRPCTPYELESYRDYTRFNALPGLTGLWQVSGKNETTFAEMIFLDKYYVRHQSIRFDLKIIAATFGTVARQVQFVRTTRRTAPVPPLSSEESRKRGGV